MPKLPIGSLFFLLISLTAVPGQQKPITATSTINWKTETVTSIIRLDTHATGVRLPEGRSSALELIEMKLPSLLQETFYSIPLDSREKLGHAVERGSLSLSELNKIIDSAKKTPPWFSSDLTSLSMSCTMPLSTLGSIFVTHSKAYEPKAPLQSIHTRAYSGIVIDARGSLPVHGEYREDTVQPCLFPKIWNTDMESVYEKNMMDGKRAQKAGIISYASESESAEVLQRVGKDPLRIRARGVFGNHRTDPVISMDDYLKIYALADNRALLKEGKIVILLDQATLESQPLGVPKDSEYYFAWGEMQKSLETVPVTRIDLSDSWEGLKLTIYDIRFVADTAEILSEEKSRLDSIADALKRAGPQARFYIEGHTAAVGKPEGERRLSGERAQKIAQEMETRGIPSDRLEATGFGGTRPIGPNETPEGRARNRRVEIIIHIDGTQVP